MEKFSMQSIMTLILLNGKIILKWTFCFCIWLMQLIILMTLFDCIINLQHSSAFKKYHQFRDCVLLHTMARLHCSVISATGLQYLRWWRQSVKKMTVWYVNTEAAMQGIQWCFIALPVFLLLTFRNFKSCKAARGLGDNGAVFSLVFDSSCVCDTPSFYKKHFHEHHPPHFLG